MPYIGQPPVTGDTTSSFRLLDNIASYTLTFDGSSAEVVSVANDTLTFSQHRFVTGQRVTYNDGGGTAIGGLSDGVYYIIKVDQNTISIAANAVDAAAGTAIDLTSLGVGTTHTLNVAFDSVNTKFKVTYGNGIKGKVTRAGQLLISINGVIQQPQETSTPSVGFGLEADSTIVFSTAPTPSYVVFGNIIANTITNFDITNNTVDSFTGDGTTVSYSLSKTPSSNNDVLVTLDGVIQYPTDTSTERAYSVTENLLTFVTAPSNGVAIQVRHIGFAGATSSAVTGFYGRTGNTSLTTTDHIVVGNINSSGVVTATSFVGGLTGDATGLTGTPNIVVGTIAATSLNATGVVTSTSAVVGSAVTITESGVEVTGVVTATSFSGSASGLTGISDTNYWASTDAGINTTAKVGIGTTNPSATLQVAGNAVGEIVTLTDGATITPDFSTSNNFVVTLGGNRTLANPTNVVAGQSGFIAIVQDGSGSRTLGYGTHFDFPAGTAPTLTTTGGAVDVLAYYCRTTTSIVADVILNAS